MRLLPVLLAALLPGICVAQDDSTDDAIHAVTVIHDDGSKTVTVTDPTKHTSEATTYTAGDKLMKKIVYVMDDQNQITSGIVYAPGNRPVYKSLYKRDDMNRVSEEDDYTMDDRLIGRFVYEYGSDGKFLRIHAFDSQGNEIQQSEARKDPQQVPPRVH